MSQMCGTFCTLMETDQGVSFYDLIENSGNNNNENNIYVRVIERAHQKTGRTRQGS